MPDDNDRPATALIDYVAVVIGPVLIMTMVGSLIFFLIDVLYDGKYPERLLHTMFFFTIGAVLVARIGIQFGTTRAMLYVLGLGFATFLAMQAYVEYPTRLMKSIGPVISLGLMAIIWWAANKLTWDCTHLDGEREAGGQGLMAATGLTGSSDHRTELEDGDEPKKKKKKDAEGFVGWVQQFNEYREARKKKPHTPGTWVIYFGLAAVPIFILGQSLIAADDGKRRFWTLVEMALFVGSGLGLLVTTSLLGLKKYLQDRGARIPGAMTASWLGLGAVLIVTFLVLGALLPRPHSETPLVSLPKAGKSERKANQVSPYKGNEAGKGEGAKGNKTEAGDGKGNAKGGKEGGKGDKGDAKSGSGSKDGKAASGGGDKKGDQAGKGNQKGDQSNDNKQGNDKQQGDDRKAERRDDDNKSESKQGDEAYKPDGEKSDGGNLDSQSSSKLAETFEKIGSGLKWIIWIVVAILVVVGIVLFILKGLAPFTAWARGLLDWFRNLFGRKKKERIATDEEEEEKARFRLPPFDSFSNPFADGSARSRPLPELVGYTFAALESWAADQELARKPGETSREFADRLLNEFPQLETCGRLSSLVNRVAYSKRPLPEDAAETLRLAWKEMDALAPV